MSEGEEGGRCWRRERREVGESEMASLVSQARKSLTPGYSASTAASPSALVVSCLEGESRAAPRQDRWMRRATPPFLEASWGEARGEEGVKERG